MSLTRSHRLRSSCSASPRPRGPDLDLGSAPARCARAPYNLVLHTAPPPERGDATYHWHWEIHPRLREIGGLELGTGLPVNPVSPEDAGEELLDRAGEAAGRSR